MGESAAERKARIKALRKAAKAGDEDAPAAKKAKTAPEPKAEPVLKFRNYAPTSEVLKENVLEANEQTSVEDTVKAHLAEAKVENPEEVDVVNLAPRKIDWDLKRDISKKLEKLERRTNRAITELIRDKLAADAEDDV